MRLDKLVLFLGSVWSFVSIFDQSVTAQTIHVSLRGKPVEGKPVYWNEGLVALVARDGQLVTFAPSEAAEYRQLSDSFRSHSQATLRGELLREFGGQFEVSGTGQFLVVHPAGQRDEWANRFEELYRSMLHYLTARGFPIGRPEFPLVAIVYPSQDQYLSSARARDTNVSPNTLGYYDPLSNRIYMYDITGQSGDASQWYINAETIIHEAAHQTAFNVGIHNRLGGDPRWIVEGLGTLFEARGVWDSRHYPSLEDRVNASQLSLYRQLVPANRSVEVLQHQLASDQLFARSPTLAYAHAWALTFYLTERAPRQYAELLRRIQQRKAVEGYQPEDRLRDFIAVFGQDLKLFDARLQRFIAELPAT
jgi:hypothetical protein